MMLKGKPDVIAPNAIVAGGELRQEVLDLSVQRGSDWLVHEAEEAHSLGLASE